MLFGKTRGEKCDEWYKQIFEFREIGIKNEEGQGLGNNTDLGKEEMLSSIIESTENESKPNFLILKEVALVALGELPQDDLKEYMT